MNAKNKKWLILDAMGVIYTVGRDLYELLIPFVWSKDETISDKVMIATYLKASQGEFPSSQLWSILGFSESYPEIEKEYLDTQLTIDEEFLQIAPEFKKHHSLALLSNDVSEWSAYLRTKFGLNDIFDEIIISGDVKVRKPDEQIYRLTLERLKAVPEDCIFVDDHLGNLNPASKLGIQTIRFVRSKEKVPFCSEFEVSSFKELLNVIQVFF